MQNAQNIPTAQTAAPALPAPQTAQIAPPLIQNSFDMLESINAVNGNPRLLTVAQKLWLGSEVVAKRTTVAKQSKQFKFKPMVLKKYVSKVRHNKVIRAGGGRARLLDDDSIRAIQVWLKDQNDTELEVLKDQMVEMINTEYVNTLKRQRGLKPEDEISNVKRVPMRTVRRYLTVFMNDAPPGRNCVIC